MYSNSNEYKNANLQPYRQFESRITIGNRIITNEEVVSINLQQSIQQEATFTIGNTISSSLNLTFLHNDIETSDREIINLEIGLLANTDYEYIPLGIYNIDLCNSNDTTTNITAYDNMVKFDISYEENNSQPTVHSIINRLSELTGVEFAGTLSNYTNYSLLSLSSYTCREVLGFVAGVLGCNAIIDRQGKFKFIGISNAPSLTITSENYFNYAKQSKLYKISKIVNEVEGKIQEKGSLTDDTVCLYVYNPLVNETILQSLYNKFYDFSFLPFELSWSGDLSLDLGDSIQIVDKKGNSLIQPILSQIFTYTGGLSSVIQSQGDTKLANTYTTSTSEEKEAERIIKRVADIEDTDTVTNIVHKYYLSTSKTELLDGTWVTKLPSSQEQQDKFLWYKTVTTYKDGITAETDPVCITGQDGAQGPQGVPGKDGQDGKDGVTYYTWIRYADTSSGGGISNDPTGKKYIGFAYNKTSPTETNNPTDYSWSLIQGEKGDQGVPGGTGADGKTFYTWIKYSDNADGTGLYDTPTATTKYIGIATNKTSQSESSNKTDYVWSQFKGEKGDRGPQGLQGVQGEKGEQGVPGTNGTNGKTSYFHIKYSSVANPTTASQMTETPNTYIGTYVDFIEADSSDPTKYTWARFEGLQGEKGEQGIPGTNGLDGMTSYLHLKYSNDGGKTFTSNNGETPGDYIGQYTDFTQADSTSTSSYAWSKIKGEKGEPGTDGAQGIPGPAGANGQTLYTWVKYSNNADGSNMTDDPNSKYIGIAVNKTTQTESTNKTDYSWSLIKGADGATGSQGVPGPPGEDGQTLYTWIKYANNSNGSGMSNSPEGKTYIGFAYNKTTPTESNNASDYSWSLIKGADGSDAKYITVSGEQVFKYTNNFSDTPTPSSIALSAVKHNMTDSCKWQYKRAGETTWYDITSITGTTYSVEHNNSTIFNSSSVKSVTFRYISTVDSTIYDEITIVKVSDGAIGPQGPQGITGSQGPQGPVGQNGVGIKSIVEYYQVSSSNTTQPTSWSTTPPMLTSTNKYLWNYEKITYTDSTTKETAKRVIGVYGDKGNTGSTGQTGPQGQTGATGNGIKTVINKYLATNLATGVTESTSGWTDTVQSVTSSKKYLWNYEVLTYTNGDVVKTTPCIIGVYGDTGPQGDIGASGKDAYTIILSNESHSFAGDTSKAIAGSTFTSVIAYKGSSKVNTTVGSISGLPTGMTASISNNGSTTTSITFSVTTSMTTKNGTITVPITVDGYSFTKLFTYSLSLKGSTGATGPQGVSVTEVNIEYAKNQSTTTAPTSGWSTTMPSYAKGYYLWMRTRIKYSNSSNYVYSTPTCDEAWKVVAQTYSEYEQLKNQFSWLVKSGTSESNMMLTDKLYKLITDYVLIKAALIELNGKVNITGTFGKVLIDDGNMTLTDKLARIVGNISGTGIGFKYLGTQDTILKNPIFEVDMEAGTFQCVNFTRVKFNGMTYGGDDWENLVLSSGVAENYSYPSRVREIAGQTEIQLSVKGITTFPKTICNLPTKYRPSRSLFLLGTYGETNPVTVKFKVTSDGDVIATGSTNTSPSATIGYFLNVTFSRA